ncbi:MAG: ankyrin repeat domain-containing protein [Acidobacteriota bacterium]
MSRVLVTIFLFLTGITCGASAIRAQEYKYQDEEYKYVVKGRVIDKTGKPVANALIVILPPPIENTWVLVGCTGEMFETDGEGKFRIEDASQLETEERLLFVSSQALADSGFHVDKVLLGPPYDLELAKKDSRFFGQKILIKKNEAVDVGDVPLQIRYAQFILKLQDQTGNLIRNKDELKNLWIQTRNSWGDMVGQGGIPRISIREEGISIAIPEGLWQLEFKLKGQVAIEPKLNAQFSEKPTDLIVRLVSEAESNPSTGFEIKDQERARLALQKMGIEFSEQAFFERIRRDNLKAVELFLAAGMNPNIRGEHSVTPLMDAVLQRSFKTAQALIQKGADVNVKTDKGMTALMMASIVIDTEDIVEFLLKNGADVNTKDSKGKTALIYAAMNNYSEDKIKLLLDAGADPTIKDLEGKTALMWARETNQDKVVQLLKQAEANRK